MKNLIAAVLMVVFAQSAFALNNSMLDQALNANLKEKQGLQTEHSQVETRPKAVHGDQLKAKYQIIEVGDEMGSFAAARGYKADNADLKDSDSAKEIQKINAEISDSTL